LNINLFADRYPYRGSIDLIVNGKRFIIHHKHNWEIRLKQLQEKSLNTAADSLKSSSITCIEKRTGDTIFYKPCAAFTSIFFDKRQKYIIGISNIMRSNPYQLCIYDIFGNLIKSRAISKVEAKLTKYQYEEFKFKFKELNDSLISSDLIFIVDSLLYIDFLNLEDDSAWSFLNSFRSRNHLSENITGSVSNYIYWYNYDPQIVGFTNKKEYYDPKFKMQYHRGELVSLTFLDPKRVRRKIFIKE
jgi:hypothetical protein